MAYGNYFPVTYQPNYYGQPNPYYQQMQQQQAMMQQNQQMQQAQQNQPVQPGGAVLSRCAGKFDYLQRRIPAVLLCKNDGLQSA